MRPHFAQASAMSGLGTVMLNSSGKEWRENSEL